MNVEITLFAKNGGPLTKRITLGKDGKPRSDGSACRMAHGEARRLRLNGIAELAAVIDTLNSCQAIALGALRDGLPERVAITTKDKLNGQAIARSASNIVYCQGRAALMLFDFDSKGMPAEVKADLQRFGGFWPALLSAIPGLSGAGRVARRSTSAGLYRADTGVQLAGSGGEHDFIVVTDGADVERALRAAHDRCWLADLGWLMVGESGQLLERSIVDRMVGTPERLVFEGPPILTPPLAQSRELRRPQVHDGAIIDTVTAIPPLTVTEQARLGELKARRKVALAAEAVKARAAYIASRAGELAQRAGITAQAAAHVIARQCEGVLLPDVVLPFDDKEFAGCTVGDVLADPARFAGATLADPVEGVGYGRGCAKIMIANDGTPWVHSFAHGRAIYQLRYDAAALRKLLEQAVDADVLGAMIRLDAQAEIDEAELEDLIQYLKQRTGRGIPTIKRMVRQARERRAAAARQAQRERRRAARNDQRPQLACPALDTPWLPVMGTILEVVAAAPSARRIKRNIDEAATRPRRMVIPRTHAFSGADDSEPNTHASKLPTPEQWALLRMTDMELAEEIERHIDFVDEDGRSVHLPMQFVRHFLQRNDGLPTIVAIAAQPIVLADGAMLAEKYGDFDDQRGIHFVIPPEMLAILPRREDCTDDAVRKAMQFLCDEWLVDVASDFTGKATLVAAALTIIERSLLPDRPVFFITGGRRGAGKTTTIKMLTLGVTGIPAMASAWSTSEEERRKALLAYFMYGVPYILWDNIKRGSTVSCPHIEKSCTSAYYADRKLGVSEMVATAASSIHIFTGNNIGPRGDLASRSLCVRHSVDRADPENRNFQHPDPLGWTEDNRAEILQALFTILLGNPSLDLPRDAQMRTRFKLWQRLVGSAVEHASSLMDEKACFADLFQAMNEEDEEETSLAAVLETMSDAWPDEKLFTAQDLCDAINDKKTGSGGSGDPIRSTYPLEDGGRQQLRGFFCPKLADDKSASAKSVGLHLKNHVDEPVGSDGWTFVLRSQKNPSGGGKGGKLYKVVAKKLVKPPL